MKFTQQPIRRNRAAHLVAVHQRVHAHVRPRHIAGETPNIGHARISLLPAANVGKLGFDGDVQIGLGYSLDSQKTMGSNDYRVTRCQTPNAHHAMTTHFINNRRVQGATGESIPVLDPSDGQVFAHLARGHVEDIRTAIAAARKAADGGAWSRLAPMERRRRCTNSPTQYWPITTS